MHGFDTVQESLLNTLDWVLQAIARLKRLFEDKSKAVTIIESLIDTVHSVSRQGKGAEQGQKNERLHLARVSASLRAVRDELLYLGRIGNLADISITSATSSISRELDAFASSTNSASSNTIQRNRTADSDPKSVQIVGLLTILDQELQKMSLPTGSRSVSVADSMLDGDLNVSSNELAAERTELHSSTINGEAGRELGLGPESVVAKAIQKCSSRTLVDPAAVSPSANGSVRSEQRPDDSVSRRVVEMAVEQQIIAELNSSTDVTDAAVQHSQDTNEPSNVISGSTWAILDGFLKQTHEIVDSFTASSSLCDAATSIKSSLE